MKYEAKYLVVSAVKMWADATWIVYTTAAKYTIVTGLVTYVAGFIFRTVTQNQNFPIDLAVAIFTGVALMLGIYKGKALAFDLRVRAQELFALVQIERNTHPASEASEKILQA